MVRYPVVTGFKPFIADLALTRTASAVMSREFAHSHKLPGTVLSEEPDDILFRVSDKRPVHSGAILERPR
jgi:hypothetical protein